MGGRGGKNSCLLLVGFGDCGDVGLGDEGEQTVLSEQAYRGEEAQHEADYEYQNNIL